MKYYFTQFLILKNLFEIYIQVYLTSYWETIVVEILETVEQEHSMGIHDNQCIDGLQLQERIKKAPLLCQDDGEERGSF